MKIYTKKGDKGDTQLLGGSTVKKDHMKLECYGTIDELNAFIGNIYDQEINSTHKDNLLKIQNKLFNLGCCLSFDNKGKNLNLPNHQHYHYLRKYKRYLIEKYLPIQNWYWHQC